MITTFKLLYIIVITSFIVKPIIEVLNRGKSTYFNLPKQKFIKDYQYVQAVLTLLILFLHGAITIGVTHTLIYLVYSAIIGTVAEVIFLKTGCLGKFYYTDKIKPKLFGILPFYIPLMWSILSYIGLWTAIALLYNPKSGSLFSDTFLFVLTPLLITFVDLLGDPIAADDKFWIWEEKGSYSGIPIMNYAGWFITSSVITIPFIYVVQPLKIELLPSWIFYTPAFGYYLYFIVMVKICYEKRLLLPRNLGLFIIAALTIWGTLKFSSLL